jgi:hypothetical protein
VVSHAWPGWVVVIGFRDVAFRMDTEHGPSSGPGVYASRVLSKVPSRSQLRCRSAPAESAKADVSGTLQCVLSKSRVALRGPPLLRRARGSFCPAREQGPARADSFGKSNLVDPASSHMLVSKIKPCMSKYKFYTAKL